MNSIKTIVLNNYVEWSNFQIKLAILKALLSDYVPGIWSRESSDN